MFKLIIILGSLRSMLQLLVTINTLPSSSILDTLVMEEIRFSETSVIARPILHTTPEDGFL
jgi:hypothetical protein